MSVKVRVVVADDHPVFREGVVRALVGSGQIEVVAEADDGRVALALIEEHDPAVAVLDLKLPGLDGIEVTHALTRDGRRTRVLLLTAFTDSPLVFRALEAGAAGYLPKDAKRLEIVDATLAVARGENVVAASVASGLATEIHARRESAGPMLTAREHEILRLIAAGQSVPDIARTLFLGATTVKTHVGHLYGKLGVSDRAAAVAEAMRRKLIE